MCNGVFLVRLETPLEAEFRVHVHESSRLALARLR